MLKLSIIAFANKWTSYKEKLSVQIITKIPFQNPSPIIRWANLRGFSSSFIFEGTILINFPLTSLYHSLWSLENKGKLLEENQYWVANLPDLPEGQGVGSEIVQISL